MEPLQSPSRMAKEREKWWKVIEGNTVNSCVQEPREGQPCPACLLGDLHYNGLFQLICDNCGRVAEAAVFT